MRRRSNMRLLPISQGDETVPLASNQAKKASPPEEQPARKVEPEKRLKFTGGNSFQTEVRRRVDEYFRSTGRPQRDCFPMYLKTAVVFSWFAISYGLLVFWAETWWQALPLAVS